MSHHHYRRMLSDSVEELAELEKSMNGVVAPDASSVSPTDLKNVFVFAACDGDGIGNKVARASLADDVEGLHEVSAHIEAGQELIRDFAVSSGGQVISSGGDEGLIRIKLESVENLESLRTDYSYAVSATLSIGVGQSPSQASKALMVAKLSGKNRILQYTPEVEQKYQQASQEANSGTPEEQESKKIGNAYMKNAEQVPAQDPQNPPTEAQSEAPPAESGAPAEDDHSDCPYCNEANEELADDDCPYCAEDDQLEQQAGLDDCPYCQEAHPQEQHEHGDDCVHCQELDNAQPQEGAPSAEQNAGQVAPDQMPEDAPADPASSAPPEFQTEEHQSPEQVMGDFDEAHGDPSQGASDTDQIGDVGIAEGGTGQEENVSRPDDFNGDIQEGSDDPSNTDGSGPNYGEVLQDGMNQNSDDIQREKVGDVVRQALQAFKANKDYLEQAKAQSPQFYQANIGMIRAMIEMAKLLGFAGPAGGQQPELGQEQAQMVDGQPDPSNPFPVHPENGSGAPTAGAADPSGQPDPSNPFPAHPENGGDAGKTQGQ